MKRILLGIAGVVMLAFVVILFVNAGKNTPEIKKVQTELNKDTANSPCMMLCNHSTDTKAKSCDPANCKGTNCDPEKCKNTGCNPSNCKGNCEKAGIETKSCDPANCPGHSKELLVK